jgi:hypothetical protein
MALINCDECGKEVSDKAASCPNCGAPIAPVTRAEPAKKKQKYATVRKCKFCGRKLKKVSGMKSLASGQAPGPFGLSYPTCGKCGRDNR